MRSALFLVLVLLLVNMVLSSTHSASAAYEDPVHCPSYYVKCYLQKKVQPNFGSPSNNIIPGYRLCDGTSVFT